MNGLAGCEMLADTLTGRHAYLIMTHERPEALQRLISEIDDGRNDIFVHIDRKASFDGNELHCNHSRLTLIGRRDGRWAHYSLVDIEMDLLQTAVDRGPFDYYHLLSGVDVAVKSQDEIHEECRRLAGTEFIALAPDASRSEIHWRAGHRFIFDRRLRSYNKLLKFSRHIFNRLQDAARLTRPTADIYKGSQWWSITHNFATYALGRRSEMERRFRHTFAPDEMVFQTLAVNSMFAERLANRDDEFDGSRRYITWINGELQDLTAEAISEARKSNRWFARKLPKFFDR